MTPPHTNKSNKQNEDLSQHEDSGNFCPKNDNGCSGRPDGPEPESSWCSNLKGGYRNFTVCDECDYRYEKSLLPKDGQNKDN